MRADDQLIAAVVHRLHQEIRQDQLVLRAQAVFRLIQEAKRIHLDLALEIYERAFPVGPLAQAFSGLIRDKTAHRFAPGLIDPMQPFQIIQ